MKIISANITGSLILNNVDVSSITGSQSSINSLNNKTGSYAVTGSNVFIGNQTITGSLIITETITGSISNAISSSYASNSDLLDGRDSLTFAGTGSNVFIGNQNINGSVAITGSLTTTGTITAQTINVQQVTSSIVYSSGSNVFGNSLSNTQSMTGSVGISGSLSVNGISTLAGSLSGTSATFSGLITSTLGNNTILYNSVSATTGYQYVNIQSGNARLIFGIEAATPASIFNGTLGNSAVIGSSSATGTFHIATNATVRQTIDASGNVGIGVIPSAWSILIPALEIGTGGSFISAQGSTSAIYIGTNTFFNGTNWIYKTNGVATYSIQNSGSHIWFNAPSGTAGNAISFTQAMTLDASGRLGIGTSSPIVKLQSNISTSGLPATSGTSQTNGALRLSSTATSGILDLGINSSNNWIQSTDSGDLSQGYNLLLNPRGGNVLIGTTTDAGFKLDVNGTGRFSSSLRSTGGDVRSIGTGSNTAGSGPYYLLGDTTGTNFFINQLNASNGLDWYYYNGSYSASLFKLASTGAVTSPNQVGFKAYISGANPSASKGANNTIPYNATVYNYGSGFNIGTYVFTAPVAGRYIFTANVNTYSNDSTATYLIRFYKNSALYTNGLYIVLPTGNTGDIVNSVSQIIDLALNDTVNMVLNNSGSGTYYYSAGISYNSFSGQLLS